MSYQKDAAYNLYFRPGAEAFGYSEGAEAERRLLDIVESISDRSTFSDEYLERIVDWSTRYHFSRARHCLLRPLDIGPGERVLELGCGTGAITRYLGETGAQVTAVEGSLARARVAAARCHDLPNVTVIADDLQAVDVEGRYDWVTLIGVLEYAGAYSRAEDPWLAYLAAAMRHLKPGGRIVIAIENQLGLKYFNGCGEDHLARPFAGIQDLYPSGGVRTFGRKALGQVLERAGLTQQQWLYPYPDYKVPNVVLSDAALAHPDFDSADLLLRNDSEDYNDNLLRAWDEALVQRVLDQNGLLADFSNSFLVVASPAVQAASAPQGGQAGSAAAQPARADDRTGDKTGDKTGDEAGDEAGQGATRWQPAALAWSFSAVHRQTKLCTETRFLTDEDGGIRVSKQRIHPDLPDSVPMLGEHRVALATGDSRHFPGRQMAWRTLWAHAADGSLPAIVQSLRPWCETLLASARVEVSPLMAALSAGAGGAAADQLAIVEGRGKPVRMLSLPGHAADLVPFNILVDESGRQQVIDQEWVVSCPVPAGWVVTRGVMHALMVGIVPRDALGSVPRVIIALLDSCGYYATPEDIDLWFQVEEAFLKAVSARRVENGLYVATRRPVPLMLETVAALRDENAGLRQQAADAQAHAQALNRQLAEQNTELVANLSRIDQCQQRIRELEQEVETLLGSRSWRWSSWLRTLRRRSRI